jgi:hypothetical protein
MIHEIIQKNGVTFGIITGLTSVLITTLIYAIDLELFTSWWIGLLNISLYIIIAVLLLTKTKKELNGIFSFKDAFTTYFISALTGILISVVFNIILFNLIDPAAKETIKELTIKYMTDAMGKFNAPAATINKAIEDLQENDQFSVSGLLKGSLTNIVFSTIFGLVLAAFFKSKPSSQEQ